jgi:hypothetical protein
MTKSIQVMQRAQHAIAKVRVAVVLQFVKCALERSATPALPDLVVTTLIKVATKFLKLSVS